MEFTSCIICCNNEPEKLFEKPSENGDLFTLVKCPACGLEYVNPRPGMNEIGDYYRNQYFTRRSDRGYDNYFSPELRYEIERVMKMNLSDLGFYGFESMIENPAYALDIGCAAGYFVRYLQDRGWQSRGIDISPECVDHAVNRLGVRVQQGNVLDAEFSETFHLVTLWATIEHLHHPHLVLQKAWEILKPGGYLYISTCRTGPLSFQFLKKKNWRFYNFPEHLYFFNEKTLGTLLWRYGFIRDTFITYGSGMGKPGSIPRKIADFTARHLYLGDMMLISARKPSA